MTASRDRPDPRIAPASLPEVALLASALLVLVLPAPWSVLVLVAVLVAWLGRRPPGRELVFAGSALGVAVACLAFDAWTVRPRSLAPSEWSAEATRRYAELWRDLDRRAADAEAALRSPPADRSAELDAFALLGELVAGRPGDPLSLLWVDPDGNAVAWAGSGFLHEPRPYEIRQSGSQFVAGFDAVTLMSIRPIGEERRPWRVVAGRSLATDRLPFDPPGGGRREGYLWSLVDDPGEAAPEARVLTLPERPAMVVARPEAATAPRPIGRWRRAGWAALGLALLALAVGRGLGLLLFPHGERLRAMTVSLLAIAGMTALTAALALSGPPRLALLVGIGVAVLGLSVGRDLRWGRRRPPWAGVAAGAGAGIALAATAYLYLGTVPAAGLSPVATTGPDEIAARLALWMAGLGLLGVAGFVQGPPSRDRGAWLAAAGLLAAGALADFAIPALALLVAGSVGGALWLRGRPAGARVGSAAILALLTALLAAAAWEIPSRLRLDRRVAGLADEMGPPSGSEMTELENRVRRYFAAVDLERLAPRSASGMDTDDLAYSVWRGSPLVRGNALSGLVIQPLIGARSVFTLGVRVGEDGRAEGFGDSDTELPKVWNERRIAGEADISAGGKPWGKARWWLVPRPGFALDLRPEPERVRLSLLSGAPRNRAEVEGLPRGVSYGLFDNAGEALIVPWEEGGELPAALAGSGPAEAVVALPGGRARAFARSGVDGRGVLFRRLPAPTAALERPAVHVVGTLSQVALGALFGLLLSLPRAAVRDLLRQTLRSFPKRLMLIFTLLLLVPLLLLNFVFLRTVQAQLDRDQRSRGEQALSAAQRLVSERLLSLEPGFDVNSVVGNEALRSFALVVDHDINLYFGPDFAASSKAELFDAGLLPRRIPGQIFARLDRGGGIAARRNRVGSTSYLEIYAPLSLPGDADPSARLFLSVPLLAQEEEVAEVVEALRRRAITATAALFAILLAVGSRLARNFTGPLAEVVAGTRRIADGAPSLDLAPKDLELAQLATAVDEMAQRIAEGRARLLREKEVVDRMVASITSGVVSLDADNRVLMLNRVAADLLGLEVGVDLARALAAEPRLEPVAGLVERAAAADDVREPLRETVRLTGEGESEKEWTLVWVPLPGPGEPSALLVVEDVTQMLRGQRLAAWAEMARIIAHEIKNPLTPVRLSAEHMRQVWDDDRERFDEVFQRCTNNILRQVDELQEIASEFSIYSHIPRAELVSGDLVTVLADLAEGYAAAPPPGVRIVFTAPDEPMPVRLDRRLLRRAVRNLLENAIRASGERGRVEIVLSRTEGYARVVVRDDGPGVPAENLSRIFDPYFSTHDTGTGLGLPITSRIVEEHDGEIVAHNRKTGGLEVEIRLPLA